MDEAENVGRKGTSGEGRCEFLGILRSAQDDGLFFRMTAFFQDHGLFSG
jgi:hypothetical protein